MPVLTCSAILFDVDGVLVDSTRSVARHWRIWAAEHNVDFDQLMSVAHGRRTSETIALVAPHLNAPSEVERIETREAQDTDGVTVMPGALDLIRSIPDGRWGVVTSGTRLLATARLKLAGIPLPSVLVTAESVGQGKPHPEPYEKGAQLLGVDPDECIVIEDAPAGIESAHAAGPRVIALASTYPVAELRTADAIVRSLIEIRLRVADRLTLELP